MTDEQPPVSDERSSVSDERSTGTDGRPPVTVDCYVRASMAGHHVASHLETARDYDERDVVEACTVEHWPAELRLTPETAGNPVRERYRQFREWADDEGVSLEPAFSRRERTTLVTDDRTPVLVLPVLCLAVRVGGELACVAPHTTGTSAYTVADGLADLASLPRVRSLAVAELDADHPLRSALAARADEPRSSPETNE